MQDILSDSPVDIMTHNMAVPQSRVGILLPTHATAAIGGGAYSRASAIHYNKGGNQATTVIDEMSVNTQSEMSILPTSS